MKKSAAKDRQRLKFNSTGDDSSGNEYIIRQFDIIFEELTEKMESKPFNELQEFLNYVSNHNAFYYAVYYYFLYTKPYIHRTKTTYKKRFKHALQILKHINDELDKLYIVYANVKSAEIEKKRSYFSSKQKDAKNIINELYQCVEGMLRDLNAPDSLYPRPRPLKALLKGLIVTCGLSKSCAFSIAEVLYKFATGEEPIKNRQSVKWVRGKKSCSKGVWDKAERLYQELRKEGLIPDKPKN